MDERDFSRFQFKMSFGRISYTVTAPASYVITQIKGRFLHFSHCSIWNKLQISTAISLPLNYFQTYHQETKFANPTRFLLHIPQCTIQNRNVHISVLNGVLWDMGQPCCGIWERLVYCNVIKNYNFKVFQHFCTIHKQGTTWCNHLTHLYTIPNNLPIFRNIIWWRHLPDTCIFFQFNQLTMV